MHDVDYRSMWEMYSGPFAIWYVPAALVVNMLLLRGWQRFSIPRSLLANVLMTLASSLIIIRFPLALIIDPVIHDRFFPFLSGAYAVPFSSLAAVTLSGLLGTAAATAVLRYVLRLPVTRTLLLAHLATIVLCIALAAWRMIAYAIDHPPEA